jgi:hypothetical protein
MESNIEHIIHVAMVKLIDEHAYRLILYFYTIMYICKHTDTAILLTPFHPFFANNNGTCAHLHKSHLVKQIFESKKSERSTNQLSTHMIGVRVNFRGVCTSIFNTVINSLTSMTSPRNIIHLDLFFSLRVPPHHIINRLQRKIVV